MIVGNPAHILLDMDETSQMATGATKVIVTMDLDIGTGMTWDILLGETTTLGDLHIVIMVMDTQGAETTRGTMTIGEAPEEGRAAGQLMIVS